jgi:aryl-alcohol dehydrogenase
MRRSFGGRRPDGSVTLHQGEHPVHGSFFGQSSFATYSLCTARNAVKVRRDAPLELLGPLGCGVQTGAGAVINSLAVRPGQSIAVFGAGAVGLSAIMAARLVGASHVVAFDRVDSRLKLARELGATHVADPSQGSVADILRQITGGGVDFALDTTGVLPVMQHAIGGLAVRGTFAYVANTKAMEPLPLALAPLMARGGTIRGVIQGDSDPHRFIPMLLDYYMEGRFPFDRMVKFYAFDQINEAIEDSRQGSTIKPILRMGG